MHPDASSNGNTAADRERGRSDDAEISRLALPGGYELVRRLASGGFGTVYEARQLSTGQRVAIKILHPGDAVSPGQPVGLPERLRHEMQLCGELSHPNIVRLIDSGETDTGLLYAVFEFVPGTTLREVLDREGRLDVGEAVHLMAQVLDALSSAHALGIVHRDLKPENVMISRTGVRRNALVLDFGLGGLLDHGNGSTDGEPSGGFVGTPAYAAPEQIRGDAPSIRSDIYSWGMVFIECLTGEPAMGRGSPAEIVHRQLDDGAVPIPEMVRGQPLGRLLQVVTAKRVVERDATAEGLLHALDRIERQAPDQMSGALAMPGDALLGERRQVTIVSCRLTIDPRGATPELEEVDQLLHAQHSAFAEIAAQHGGRLASAIADRVVLLFGYAQASEDSARRAVRAALELVAAVARANERNAARGLRLGVRVGGHTGVIVAREHRQGGAVDLVGVTPQTAAAIESRAPEGAVLVSAATRALLRDGFALEPAGVVDPPDAEAPTELFRVLDAASSEGIARVAAETPLVGRRREVEALGEAWREASQGHARSMLLLGEAGVGKSRVLRELRRQVPPEAWLACRCTPENRTSPLRPFVDLLGTVREPLGDLLERHGLDVPSVLPLLEALLGRGATDSKDEPGMTPERQKELTLETLVRLLLRMSEAAPLVLAIEDLHWADATTVELVTRIVQEIAAAGGRSTAGPGLCAVMTGRPEFSPPWSPSPGSLVVLPRFGPDEVREMVAAAAPDGEASAEDVVARIVERSDGIPLFVEEMARLLVQAGRVAKDGSPGDAALESIIPGTLRDLLTARLDAVHDTARETAQLAAVLGREFRYELLRAVSSRAELDLREELSALAAAGLVLRQHQAQSESWFFKHALLRDAAYESIVRPARRRLHQRVVRTLRERFPDFARRRPDALALHHEGAGEIEHAIESWQLAADSALRKAAFVESQQQAERAIGLLDQVVEDERRDRLRLDLLTTMGTAQFNVLGLSAPPVEETFRQAEEIAQRIDSEISVMVLNGLWSVQFARGNEAGIARLLPFMHRLADRTDDAMAALTGNTGVGIHAFWNGEFAKGRDFGARARAYYGHPDVRRFVRNLGWDGTMYCYSVEFLCLWHLGFPDRARALCEEMMERVAVERNPTAIAPALGFEAMLLRELGEHDAAIRSADRLIAMATEQKLYLWMAIGFLCRSSGMVGSGDGAGALPMLQQGLMILKTIGTLLSYAYYQVDLAQAQLLVGDLAAAESAIVEGLALCQTTFARFFEPELHRLRAVVLARCGDRAAAEASVQRALVRARELGARSYEVRAEAVRAELLAAGSLG